MELNSLPNFTEVKREKHCNFLKSGLDSVVLLLFV